MLMINGKLSPTVSVIDVTKVDAVFEGMPIRDPAIVAEPATGAWSASHRV